MDPIVNHLIQLQELSLIREEQKVTPGPAYVEELDASIKAMAEVLPPPVRGMFERLQKRGPVVIAPVTEGICSGCGMGLPISLVQAVRLAREIHTCPNCARMLYYPEFRVRRLGRPPRRAEQRKVGISRFSSHTLMIPRLRAATKEEAIRELTVKMQQEGFVDDAEKLVEEALRREAIVSTALDHGLAFPHVRGVEGGGLALALGVSWKGIPFDGVTKGLTRIIFFSAIPTASAAFYLKLLAGLAETFTRADARKAITVEKDPEKLWKALVKVTRTTVK